MAALLQGLKNMFTGTQKNEMNKTTLKNAYSALEVVAAKERICGKLDEKVAKGGKLNLPEARYMIQHCNKSRNQVNTVIDPLFRVTERSPIYLRNQLNMALNGKRSPISPLTYPNDKPTPTVENFLRGGKRKTHKQKRRHTKKRKHTRKH